MAGSNMAEHQGQQANNNGRWMENDIAGRLISHGYTLRTRRLDQPPPYFIRQARGLFTTMYGTPMQVDFYVWHPDKYPHGLVIESKHQEIAGSVDEKYPYLITSLKALSLPSILLLICPGAKAAAVQWALAQQEGERFRVYTTWETFISACNRGLL